MYLFKLDSRMSLLRPLSYHHRRWNVLLVAFEYRILNTENRNSNWKSMLELNSDLEPGYVNCKLDGANLEGATLCNYFLLSLDGYLGRRAAPFRKEVPTPTEQPRVTLRGALVTFPNRNTFRFVYISTFSYMYSWCRELLQNLHTTFFDINIDFRTHIVFCSKCQIM